jgi:hypothetical protein
VWSVKPASTYISQITSRRLITAGSSLSASHYLRAYRRSPFAHYLMSARLYLRIPNASSLFPAGAIGGCDSIHSERLAHGFSDRCSGFPPAFTHRTTRQDCRSPSDQSEHCRQPKTKPLSVRLRRVLVIRPRSALIRREWLRSIQRRAIAAQSVKIRRAEPQLAPAGRRGPLKTAR